MDKLTPSARSENMSRIRSRNTSPELIVRRYLHRKGLRFRLHARNLPGEARFSIPGPQSPGLRAWMLLARLPLLCGRHSAREVQHSLLVRQDRRKSRT